MNESNVTRIGNGQTATFIAGIRGANLAGGVAPVVIDPQGQLGTSAPLAGISCPSGAYLTGFDANGQPVCSAGPANLAGVVCPAGEYLAGVHTDGTPLCQCTVSTFAVGMSSITSGGFEYWPSGPAPFGKGNCSGSLRPPHQNQQSFGNCSVDNFVAPCDIGWTIDSIGAGFGNCSISAQLPLCGSPTAAPAIYDKIFGNNTFITEIPYCSTATIGGLHSSAIALVTCTL
jgi:hypothetical protein